MGLAAVLDDNDDVIDELANLDDGYLYDSDALLMSALEYRSLAVSVGDGSRGPYNSIVQLERLLFVQLARTRRWEYRKHWKYHSELASRTIANVQASDSVN